MELSRDFFVSALNTLPQNISIIDQKGAIRWANHSWMAFSGDNGGCEHSTCLGANYLHVCKAAGERGDKYAELAYLGISAVVNGSKDSFQFEYPCHSPDESRWFLMNVCPLQWSGATHFIISHTNITDRKLAEMRAEEQATQDSLTGIANRRTFDQFLELEWQLARRMDVSMSVILLDVDQFKLFNDNYGHVAGDRCLKTIGRILREFEGRRGDLVARYGGEEFALVLGGTNQEQAFAIAEEIRVAILNMGIQHDYSCCADVVTISAGVGTCNPMEQDHDAWHRLVEEADRYLYQSKSSGRNRVSSSSQSRARQQALKGDVA